MGSGVLAQQCLPDNPRTCLKAESSIWTAVALGKSDAVLPEGGTRWYGWVTLVAVAITVMAVTAMWLRKPATSNPGPDELTQGLAAQAAGQLDTAAADYRKVLQGDPRNKYAYFDLGVLAQTRADNPQAEDDYRAVLGIDPSFQAALYNLALVRAAEGDPQGAVGLYRQELTLNPQDANAHLNLGFLLFQLGQRQQGAAELARAIQLSPGMASRVPASDLPGG